MIDSPSSDAGPILVALGPEARTLRLVHAGHRLARELNQPWVALHVEVPGQETAQEADQAKVWLQEARELGAETAWVRASSVAGGLLAELRRQGASLLVLGEDRSPGFLGTLERTVAQEVRRRGPESRLVTLPLENATAPDAPVRTLGEALGVLAASCVLLAVCAIFGAALQVVAGFPAVPATFAAGVGFITHRWGPRAALPATVLAVLAYLFLFAEPRLSFAFTDWPRLLYFVGSLLLVQVLVGLVDRLRLETRTGRRREAETVLLLLLGRALAKCATLDEAAGVLLQRFQSHFQAEAWLQLPQGDAWRPIPASAPPGPPLEDLLEGGPTRRDPLEPIHWGGFSFLTLVGTRANEGLLQIRRADPFPPETWGTLQAFAVQGALALERLRALETARQAQVERETERMRSSLLGAISHDLRTPLAAIQGAASSLLLPSGNLSDAVRRDMLGMIHDESERLARLLTNLLDLTRLESGGLQLRKEWQPPDEVIGAALRRLETTGVQLDVRVLLPSELPLVPLDSVLMEQLLLNLLLNARRHAPGSPVELKAWTREETFELVVSDEGPGIPEEYRERIFDKFFRPPGREGGVGLGLAICEAIARTHGGRIWVEPSPAGGASFRLTLPLGERPPGPPAETQP